ncbi:2-Methylisocitrate lyase, PEP mutase family [Streptoalloteichus tenebrarius]|uniref:2-Methylisocitrate lyase, PEP mutase family n=1 Tax=Streptoalloteichus tenebrarius (strain ATCC 17920 / DSM 40477 / JCM 4838 / CBS 697.72 / NBRC 16177 / NCIMB 11028 / NRRL B-12390 / A12253. 1 / ISP 5477) TaxID=1933 RepID=A0ABT1HQ45_STRSD|nr:isocitrate lyase/phosphoenolpyruvate mutase family protein [Streptoalloteichus tenebrarius]MCP2257649.1 2-Methylisocitrate lyase, PEP mutase family [Streptoalloteichus tenebrarius]BFE98610.1 isocitrate lyase/phosphoenolpyruvate mutase family protein [Streptoalloteichus tenebrarius]
MTTNATTTFRALHQPGNPLLLPNAWDHATASALVAAGFPAIGTTSLGVAATHGIPDAHGLARHETLALTHRLTTLPCLVTVDIEAGFSDDPGEVADLAAQLHAAGAVGINIEDGRHDHTLATIDHQADLIHAIKAHTPDLFVNARTDTYWLATGDLTATITRAERYLDAGADGIFVPGIADDEDITTVVSAIDAPVNVLYLPARHTTARLADLGVSRISTGSLLFRAALHTVTELAEAIRAGRPTSVNAPSYDDIQKALLANTKGRTTKEQRPHTS